MKGKHIEGNLLVGVSNSNAGRRHVLRAPHNSVEESIRGVMRSQIKDMEETKRCNIRFQTTIKEEVE
jgi:hypothetical protein